MMKNLLFPVVLLCLCALPFIHRSDPSPLPTPGPEEGLSNLEFVQNMGQWEAPVRYQASLHGGKIWMENNRIIYSFYELPESVRKHGQKAFFGQKSLENETTKVHNIGITIEGALPDPVIEPDLRQPYHKNFFRGDDPSFWAEEVPVYGTIRYKEIYQGVDLRFYGVGESFKYDFIVHAGADPSQISLAYEGADDLFLKDGNLVVRTTVRDMTEYAPVAYQKTENGNRQVACEFRLDGNRLRYHFPEGFDSSLELVIDPTLDFSTFTGSTDDNWGFTATYDGGGNLYAGGILFFPPTGGLVTGYPTTMGAFQTVSGGGDYDITLSKFNSTGTALVYSTLLGGSGDDRPHSLIVNSQDELYVYGRTNSTNYPTTTNAYDNTINGGYDMYISRFNASGSSLLGSTFVGGSADDGVNSSGFFGSLDYNYGDDARGEILLDDAGDVYVASCTGSTNFPATAGAFQTTNGGQQDGVVLKMDSTLANLVWASYLGGNNLDASYGIAVDTSGVVYVTGGTSSTNFPGAAGGLNATYQGGNVDGYVGKISANGATLIQTTFIGTNSYDQSFLIQLDDDKDVYIMGQTESNTYPTSNAAFVNAGAKQFITKLNNALTSIIYSTTYGSANSTAPNISPTAFLVDICENVYVAGWGGNLNFNGGNTNGMPLTMDALQSTTDGTDFHLFVLERDAVSMLFGSYIGGSNPAGFAGEHVDGGTSRFDKNGIMYQAVCANCGGIAGPITTDPRSFPSTPGVWSPTNNSLNCNLAAFKISFNLAGITASFEPQDTLGNPLPNNRAFGCDGQPVTVQFANGASSGPTVTYQWNFGVPGGTSTAFEPTFTYTQPGTYQVQLIVTDMGSCNGSDTAYQTLNIIRPQVFADAGPDLSLCPNQSGTLGTSALPNYTYTWRGLNGTNLGLLSPPGRFVAQPAAALNLTGGASITQCYEVRAMDSAGCVAFDTACVTFNPKPLALFAATGPVCQGELSTLTFTGIRTPGTTYNWNFGSGTDVSGNSTGTGVGPHLISWPAGVTGQQTVTLQTTLNGCQSDVASQLVQVNPTPVSRFTKISPVCEGSATVLTFIGSASAAATGIWDLDGGQATGPTLGPLTVTWSSPGVKIITLQVDDLGCLSPIFRDTVVVNEIPTSTFTAPAAVCVGDSAQFVYTGNGQPSAAYTWNFDGGVAAGGGQGPYRVIWNTPSPPAKRVCLNVQQNGCFSPQTCVNVQVDEKPVGAIDPVLDQCFNNNNFSFSYRNLGAANPSDYNWDFGNGANPRFITGTPTPSGITYLTPGVKTVTLTVAGAGCQSDPMTLTLEVIPEPSADFTVSNGVTCSTDSLTFTYVGAPLGANQSYIWNFGTGANPATSSLPSPGGITYTSGGAKTVSLIVSYRGCTSASAMQVTVQDAPIFSAGSDLEFCEGDGGVQINASTLGGTPSYSYSWWCMPGNCGLSNPTTEDPFVNPSATAPDTITYFGQVTDANGCRSSIEEINIVVHPKPKVNAGPDLFLCKDAPGNFLQGGLAPDNLALGPFTWQWKDGAGNSPPHGMNAPNDKQPVAYTNPDSTTIYTLIVIDQITGCSSDVTTVDTASSVTVHVNPRPIANAGRDTVMCLDDLINLQGFASGAGPNYTYAWTPTNTGFINDSTASSPVVSPRQTTTYTLVVSSQGCISNGDQVTVTVHTIPTVSAGDDKVICQGDSVVLDGSVAGAPQQGTDYLYTWDPPLGIDDPNQANPSTSPPFTLNYILTATSQFGCGSAQDTVRVAVESTPIANMITQDITICQGDTLQLSADHSFSGTPPVPASQVVYQWEPASTVISGVFGNTVTVKPNQTTIYTVTTSVNGDCPTQDEVIVTVSPAPKAFANAADTVICSGETTTLLATGDLGSGLFLWTPGFSLNDSTLREPVATPAVTTTYNLRVTEGICSADTSITITVHQTPVVDYFSTNPEGCAGHEVSFVENTQFATSFIWDFGDGSNITNEHSPTHIYDTPGSYIVTLTAVGDGGCEAASAQTTVTIGDGSLADFTSTPTFDVQQPLPDATFNFEDLSANAISWLWDFGDGTHSAEQNPTKVYRQPGEYQVSLTVTDENGCISTVTYGNYLVFEPELFIPNVFSPNNDGVNDVFGVTYNGSEVFSMEIMDRWGKRMFVSDAASKAWEGTNPGGTVVSEGVYYYVITIGEKSYTGNLTLLR